jgi:hypothetical protein
VIAIILPIIPYFIALLGIFAIGAPGLPGGTANNITSDGALTLFLSAYEDKKAH